MGLFPAAAAPVQPMPRDVALLAIGMALLLLAVIGIWAFVAASAIWKSRWTAIRRAQGLPPRTTGPMFGRWAEVLAGRRPQPAAGLTPGLPVASSGGAWLISDPAQLIAVPGTQHRIHVSYTPNNAAGATLTEMKAQAVLRARETWWDQSAVVGSLVPDRFQHSRTLMEVPGTPAEPTVEAGRTIAWDLDFTVSGTVPPTCGRAETLACDWLLVVSVARPNLPDATLEQPIIMGQPRDRLMSGAVGQSLWSRFEETASVKGAIGVEFQVKPAPLDLAAPAIAYLLVANDGPPVPGREVRLEVRVEAIGKDAVSDSWAIWEASPPISELPAGQTRLRFEVPAINRPCPDADLPHGRLRGKLRLVVDRAGLPDVAVERDLSLCLDKPGEGDRAR